MKQGPSVSVLATMVICECIHKKILGRLERPLIMPNVYTFLQSQHDLMVEYLGMTLDCPRF